MTFDLEGMKIDLGVLRQQSREERFESVKAVVLDGKIGYQVCDRFVVNQTVYDRLEKRDL